MWGEDRFSNTEADAGSYAYAIGEGYDDRPSARDLAEAEAEAPDFEAIPEVTEGGFRCGACKARHPRADDVRRCYAERDAQRAEAAAEAEAEVASEVAFARALEARAEAGTWFGAPGPLDEEPSF